MKLKNNANFLIVLTLVGLLLSINKSLGQTIFHRGCATHAYDSLTRAKHPAFDLSREQFERKLQQNIKRKLAQKTSAEELIYTIPVVVHVIYSDQFPQTNIPDEEVIEQLEVLNQDFRRLNVDAINTPNRWKPFAADIKIQFCLATRDPQGNAIELAINRVKTINPSYDFELDDVELKANSYWPSDQYLNIWVTRLSKNILGYAQYPNDSDLAGLSPNQGSAITDGVVIDYRAFGIDQPAAKSFTNSPYVLGRTLTHEVGHWLGLFHTFGNNSGCGNQANDYVFDTPRLGKSNQGLDLCNSIVIGCGGDTAMFENYMDYTNDACMNLFTKGQKERMRSAFLTSPRRVALLESGGCCGTGVANFSPPYTQNFEDNIADVAWDDTTFQSSFKWEIYPTKFGNSAFASTLFQDSASILSPFIDLTTSDKTVMEFDVSANTSIQNSPIRIYYELTCSDTWVELNRIANLNTNWEKHTYSLTELSGQRYVRFRVEAKTPSDAEVFLDNFKIYKTSNNLESSLYPNPSNDLVYVETVFNGKHPITVKVYNSIGQLVKSFYTEVTSSTLLEFSFNELSAGTYFLKVEVNGESTIERLLLWE